MEMLRTITLLSAAALLAACPEVEPGEECQADNPSVGCPPITEGAECREHYCTPSGGCGVRISDGFCFDAQLGCVAENGTALTDPCMVCDPSASQTGLVPKSCGTGQTCQQGICVGDAPDATADADTTPDTTQDVAADTGPDVVPDTASDAAADTSDATTADATDATSADAGDVSTGDTSETPVATGCASNDGTTTVLESPGNSLVYDPGPWGPRPEGSYVYNVTNGTAYIVPYDEDPMFCDGGVCDTMVSLFSCDQSTGASGSYQSSAGMTGNTIVFFDTWSDLTDFRDGDLPLCD